MARLGQGRSPSSSRSRVAKNDSAGLACRWLLLVTPEQADPVIALHVLTAGSAREREVRPMLVKMPQATAN